MGYFTLSDLTVTDTGLTNNPDADAQSNLTLLLPLLDQIYTEIGPFTVNSAYRSPAVNAKVGGVSGSLHMQGMAADLAPHNMSAQAFFEKIAASGIRTNMGEIINESERGVVHVSLPTATMTGVLKYLQNGTYYRYAANEAKALIRGIGEQATAVVASFESNPVVALTVFTLIVGATIWYAQNRRVA